MADTCRPLIRRDDDSRVEQRCPARTAGPAPRRGAARRAAGPLARRERRAPSGCARPTGTTPPSTPSPPRSSPPATRRRGGRARPGARVRRRRHRRDDGRPHLPVPHARRRRAADDRPALAVRGLGRRPVRHRSRSAPRSTPSRACPAGSTWPSGSRRRTATPRSPRSAHGRSPTSATTSCSSTWPPGTVDPFTRAARSAAVGAALTTTYGEGHPMATLGGGVFAILARADEDPHPPLEKLHLGDRPALRAARGPSLGATAGPRLGRAAPGHPRAGAADARAGLPTLTAALVRQVSAGVPRSSAGQGLLGSRQGTSRANASTVDP